MKNFIKQIFIAITFVLISAIAFPHNTSHAQSLKTFDDIGGGGSQPSSGTSDDNSFIYILGGAAIIGILAYALFINKDDEGEETDTTTAINNLNLLLTESNISDFERELAKTRDALPVELYLGVRKEKSFISDNSYLVGLSFKF